MIYKQVFFLVELVIVTISAYAQNNLDKNQYCYPENIKHKNIKEISCDIDSSLCDCDSLHTIYYERYNGHIQKDTVSVPYSAVITIHFLDTIPCFEFCINNTFTSAYKIAVDSILLVNVAEEFFEVFSEDLPNCSYLLVHPCTRYTCPDFIWKRNKHYTIGVCAGHGFQDVMLYALYNDSAVFRIDKKTPTLECDYHNYNRLKEIFQKCE